MSLNQFRLVFIVGSVAALPLFLGGAANENSTDQRSVTSTGYPTPRYPEFVVNPTADQILDAARIAVRQTYGMAALGLAQPGQTVHVFLGELQDMEVWEAIRTAWAEREVTAVAIQPWELHGVTEAEYRAKVSPEYVLVQEGWKELHQSVYSDLLPEDVLKELGPPPIGRRIDVPYLKPFLDKHPEIQHVWRGIGGQYFSWNPLVGPEDYHKWKGHMTYVTKADLLQKAFPSDVWSLVESQIVNMVDKVSEGSFRDPEGTNFTWAVTPQQAEIWHDIVDLVNNHLFSYPNPWQAERMSGVIAGHASSTGLYPRLQVFLNDRGRVIRAEGGGLAGDLFRTLLEHPKLKNAQLPSAPEGQTGYWWLAIDGLATNPKKIRIFEEYPGTTGPELGSRVVGSERERACVQHLSFTSPAGLVATHRSKAEVDALFEAGVYWLPTNPEGVTVEDTKYALDNDLPIGHTMHIHNYFPTLRYRLRDTGEWVTICERGYLKMFDNPEVRALAARYGDPDEVLQYDWVPAIPGINAPGNYQEYASNPWSFISRTWDQIKRGTYKYFIEDYTY